MRNELFETYGLHALADGQFGSTGKGVLAAWLAEQAILNGASFAGCISNAGPNSGHTFYNGSEKHVLKQLPTFAVASYLMGEGMPVLLSAGAIIDPEILAYEAAKYPGIQIFVSPQAGVIRQRDKDAEHQGSIAAVAGTRSGTGEVLARKVRREEDAIFSDFYWRNVGFFPPNLQMLQAADLPDFDIWNKRYFLEVSQGFSLGLNSQFYPKVTSRECTVMQGMADARIPARALTKSYLSMRTFPIRVGNHEGFSSGDCYADQKETSWEALGQTPELTTVTQRIRRVFTFSEQQAREAIAANDPDFVFLNFMNYLDEKGQRELLETFDGIVDDQEHWIDVIQGYGPTSEDVKW